MQRGADRGGVKMTKRLEVLIEQIPVGIDAALITGYEIIRYYTGQFLPISAGSLIDSAAAPFP